MAPEREVAWAAKLAGHSADQVRREVTDLGRFVDRAWAAHFPAREGYITLTEVVGGPVEGVRLRVMRGDFRAQLELRCDENRSRADAQALAILVQSAAHSDQMAAVERRGMQALERSRWCGAMLGLGLFALIFWPVFVGRGPAALPLMFGFVTLAVLPLGGMVLGGYVAERLSAGARARLLSRSSADENLQTDFRRWRALARQIALKRRSVMRGARGGPFRNEAPAPPRLHAAEAG